MCLIILNVFTSSYMNYNYYNTYRVAHCDFALSRVNWIRENSMDAMYLYTHSIGTYKLLELKKWINKGHNINK